jgi:hypothetical protein
MTIADGIDVVAVALRFFSSLYSVFDTTTLVLITERNK